MDEVFRSRACLDLAVDQQQAETVDQRPQEQRRDRQLRFRQPLLQAQFHDVEGALAQVAHRVTVLRDLGKSLAKHQPIKRGIGSRKGDIGFAIRKQCVIPGAGRHGETLRHFHAPCSANPSASASRLGKW